MNDPWEEIVAARVAFQQREAVRQIELIAQDESLRAVISVAESIEVFEEPTVKTTSKKAPKESSSQQ